MTDATTKVRVCPNCTLPIGEPAEAWERDARAGELVAVLHEIQEHRRRGRRLESWLLHRLLTTLGEFEAAAYFDENAPAEGIPAVPA